MEFVQRAQQSLISLQSLPGLQRWQFISASSATAAAFCYLIVRRLRPGLARFIAVVPVVLVLVHLPMLFNHTDEIVSRTSVLFVYSWLGSFKVVGLALGRGPLSNDLTFAQFLALLALPVFPRQEEAGQKGRLQDHAGSPLQLLLRAVAKTVLLGVVVYLLVAVQLPRMVKHLVYALGMVGFLGIIMDGPASVLTSMVGLSIVPTFDRPWLSSSLADFWGRRWNVTTSSVLRTLVYDAVVEGSLVRAPQPPIAPSSHHATKKADAHHHAAPAGLHANGSSHSNVNGAANGADAPSPAALASKARVPEWRRALGMCLTFLASGLAHECIISMLQDELKGKWRWKWTVYFTIQGPLMIAELHLKRLWRRKSLPMPPLLLARLMSCLFLLLVAGPLFFGAVELDTDTADRVVTGCKNGFMSLATLVMSVTGAKLEL